MRNYRNPVFQHRHYAEIASVLAGVSEAIGPDAASLVVQAFTNKFANDNERFNAARFYAAARGVPTNGRDKR